jgi:hypothetical protein
MNDWYPANSKVSGYTRKNYTASLDITGGTRNQNFHDAVQASQNVQSKLSSGTFGTVYKLGDPRFVLKYMMIDNGNNPLESDHLKIFLNEEVHLVFKVLGQRFMLGNSFVKKMVV